MRWIMRKVVFAAITALAVRLVDYFLTDTGKPGQLARQR